MKERPILFSTPMVKAILDGRKTQTRRVLKFAQSGRHCDRLQFQLQEHAAMLSYRSTGDNGYVFFSWDIEQEPNSRIEDYYRNQPGIQCPYGKPGDRLWVRETWRPCQVPQCGDSQCIEWASTERCKNGHMTTLNRKGWKPSIHMFRWMSRITLEITNVRVERLNEISEADARSEGVVAWHGTVNGTTYIPEFRLLWDKLNGKTWPWISNPWVWVIEFKII